MLLFAMDKLVYRSHFATNPHPISRERIGSDADGGAYEKPHGISTVAVFQIAAGVNMTDCNSHADGTMQGLSITTTLFHCVVSSFNGQFDTQVMHSPPQLAWK